MRQYVHVLVMNEACVAVLFPYKWLYNFAKPLEEILKNAVSKCPAAGQGLKWTKCPAVRSFHRISTERFF